MASSGRFVSLLRQGWNEIPEVLASGALAAVLIAAASYKVFYLDDKNDASNHKYKLYPIYMRPDDPRVAKLHKD